MTRLHLLVVAVALCASANLACVPSTADLGQAGAAGFQLAPSDATRGLPFDTVDGYRVGIDEVVFLLDLEVTPTRLGSTASRGGSDTLLFSGEREGSVFVPGISVGEASLSVSSMGLYLDDLVLAAPAVADDVRPFLGRFQKAPDFQTFNPMRGPTLLIAFHAEGHGQRYRASVTLTVALARQAVSLVVTANALATVPLAVHAERFFMTVSAGFGTLGGLPPSVDVAPTFAELAGADADGDGVLTAAELYETKFDAMTLQEQLRMRAQRLLDPML